MPELSPVTGRDPRVDPMAGDTISRDIPTALEGVILRDVITSHGHFVRFRQDNGTVARPRIQSIIQWRKWAEKAKVCDVAE